MATKMNRAFGWRPELPDQRDLTYGLIKPTSRTKLVAVDLRGKNCPPVMNQGSFGSCVGNASVSDHIFEQRKQPGGTEIIPSRMFVWNMARAMEGTLGQNEGCYIRDAFKVLAKYGVCSESEFPYAKVNMTKKPPAAALRSASRHQVIKYYRLDTSVMGAMRADLKTCLGSGHPFVFGATLYESFDRITSNGMVPMPKFTERAIGGHAMLCVGFDDRIKGGRFIVMNSWGKKWGDGGFCYFPYDYLTSPFMAADFWTIRQVEEV